VGADDPGAGQATDQNDEGQGSEDYSLANDFLKNIPDVDKPVVEKYIKDWDAGVTNKFKEIHGQYAPYKELGEVDRLRDAVQLIDYVNEYPEAFLKDLARELGVEIPSKTVTPPVPPTGTPPGTQNGKDALQGLPPEFLSQWEQQNQLVQSLAQTVIAQDQKKREEQEMAQIESLFSDLQKKYGEFDEDSVLTKMARGVDAEKAVKEWVSKFGKPKAPEPPDSILTTGGLPAGNAQRIADLSRDETKNLVAKMLLANQQQG
jgi:hypothetical protein